MIRKLICEVSVIKCFCTELQQEHNKIIPKNALVIVMSSVFPAWWEIETN